MLEKLQRADFDIFYKLLAESFPPSEIRSYEGQKNLLELDEYEIYVLKKDDELLAFFAEWANEDFRFVEHLAVNPSYRSQGLGSKTLKAYHEQDDRPVILEVETPKDEVSKKRIKFYEKNGYYLSNFQYMQPIINKGYDTVELVLMTYPKLLDSETLKQVKAWLNKTVYMHL